VSHSHSLAGDTPVDPITHDAFRREVLDWSDRVDVDPREIHIAPMKRKWASCSARGRLTFDAGLLAQPAYIRDEVIVHELLHMKLPNHGRLFKALLRIHIGTASVDRQEHPD
jgi:predicted metal-dependent hydrolase